jgi:hypothetical protein
MTEDLSISVGLSMFEAAFLFPRPIARMRSFPWPADVLTAVIERHPCIERTADIRRLASTGRLLRKTRCHGRSALIERLLKKARHCRKVRE